MRQLIRRLAGTEPVYVQIKSDSIRLRDVASGKEIEDAPVLAVSRERPRAIVAAGRAAEDAAARQRVPCDLLNGFDHPRVIIDDFYVAEKTLRYFLRKLLQPGFLRVAPIMVLHPLGKFEGGLASMEVRALQELGAGAGARRVYVWSGHELHDHELRQGMFKQQDGLVDSTSILDDRRSTSGSGKGCR